ncbi:putative molybdopterin biosynthesis protein MoeA/LysR substrate binding-domain-containing protein [Hartmannibacter diazotrophicus]|uniref:Putative molybdopterin biosynthesis protein MoeA/LysR substrate binding-domain-containing protein n=1 Tax=Hartmannibacter diazotrophicus TaxID=1482074 RepID=A0A2C9D4S6_9HYPH|nr:helix-turn-helix transcriptional regulator [Hartmannibacter diazotrophicus]SON55304.1 putative molybdopterin biosynthesis protein MoeA/LysR substrate binding-domain-containing protein [Hartmannibacter diazotrophicus]
MTASEFDYLTTKELADLLRIKERKVYDLAANGEVPCARVVGKLLFPRTDIEAWIASSRSGPVPAKTLPPEILAGSHDPLLEWALRESGSGLAAFFDGSLDGLDRLARGAALTAGMHVPDGEDGWNIGFVRGALGDQPVVLIEFAKRQRGLIVAQGNPHSVSGLADIKTLRVARRQPTSGSQHLIEALLRSAGLDPDTLAGPPTPARTETDAALMILDGKADAIIGLPALAAQYHLDFVPLVEERFDLLVWRRAYFEKPFQDLLAFFRSESFLQRAAEMPGYDVSGLGTVHFNGAS